MKCPECEIELPNGSKFCKECGRKLELTCPGCGNNVPSDSKFCLECGHSLISPEHGGSPKDLSFDEKLAKIQKYLPTGLTEKILSSKERIEGERRHVTIMFVDMKGFTPLTEKLGPEETFGLMNQVLELIIHKVHEYEGTVMELRGDGILAFFGAPIALEDSPQLAIRSSLAIHRELTRFNDKIKGEKEIPPVLVRIGINSGPVVVGAIGTDLRVQLTAVGDTINMAARMEQLAEPGTTHVTEETFKLAEGYFRFEALGEEVVKGKADPIKMYRVIAPRTKKTRFDVSAVRGLTLFVGREAELKLLIEGFEQSKQGNGQAFSFVGEAGVGKSRLLCEFRKAVDSEDVTFLEGQCLSYSKGVPYSPIIDLLKACFQIQDGETDDAVREKVKKGLDSLRVDEASTLPYLLELLSIEDSGIDSIPLGSGAKKERIIGALKRVVIRSAELRPLVLVIEDLQWMDSSSQDVVKVLLESIPAASVLLLFTYRPEFTSSWGGKSLHSQVHLRKLSEGESLAMVADLVGTDKISSDIEALILEKTEGVPFFIEEFVRSLEDLKISVRTNNKYHLVSNMLGVVIPATIEDVIMTRIDTMPETAREILQIGSVIGREFSHDMIKLVTGLPENQLMKFLAVMRNSELVYERGVYPESTYIFKHALISDVCYQSLLMTTREKYHRMIAQTLEDSFPHVVRERPEIVGHHLSEARLALPAVPYWKRAAEIAIRRSANLEAIGHLNKAIDMLSTCPDTLQRAGIELDLQIVLGSALMALKGYTAPEVETAYERARELCQRLGDAPRLFNVLRGLWGIHTVRGQHRNALELGNQCLALAETERGPALVLWGHHMVGQSSTHLGDLISAKEQFDKAISLYDAHKNRSPRALQDPGVACLSYKAPVLWLLGYPEQALEASSQALARARTLTHPFSLAYALGLRALVCQFCGKSHEVLEYVEPMCDLGSHHEMPYWTLVGQVLRAWTMTEHGQIQEGIAEMRRALAAYSASGANLMQPYWLTLLAEAQAKMGEAEEGIRLLDEAQAIAETSAELWCQAELHRLRGELLLSVSSSDDAEGEACFRQALETARRQRTKSLELRAAISLSRLWEERGKKEEAFQLLAEIYGFFTEGFDHLDLREAKVILDRFK